MGDRLKGRVAIVTGSGQGIGKAIATALAKEGAQVVINDMQPEMAEGTAQDIVNGGRQAIPFVGDISNFELSRKMILRAVDNFGRIDILINNAGLLITKDVWNMTEEDWDRVVDSCLKGSFNCIRHACHFMKEQNWGRIINATSVAWLGQPETCGYCAAKAGIVGLTKAIAMEMGGYGVTCNAYSPLAATRMTISEEARSRYKKKYEMGFIKKERYEELKNPPGPETVPPLLVYLCTEEASHINGRVFDIDRGTLSLYSEPTKEKTIYKARDLWTIEELSQLVPKTLLAE